MAMKQQKIQRMIEIISAETRKQVDTINESAVLQANHDANKILVELSKKADQDMQAQLKQAETDAQIKHSQAVTKLRMRYLLKSDGLVRSVRNAAFEQASARCDAAFCARLVEQCCAAMQTTQCRVQCLEGQFEQIQQSVRDLKVERHPTPLSKATGGGVVCYAANVSIYVDNTIAKRVDLAMEKLSPDVTGKLFPPEDSCLW